MDARTAPLDQQRKTIGKTRSLEIAAIIVLFGFALRMLLADTSYWYDEFLSVLIYGTNQKSGLHAVYALALNSIHPPLYQGVLYYWMAIFGDSEVATRALSNLYVAGATLWVFLLVERLYGLRAAIIAAVLMTFMYVPIFYGLETRSYAQSIFLSTLSSLLLFHFLDGLGDRPSWRALFRNVWLYALIGANTALLLTHYYNVFFVAAQGLFLLTYMPLRERAILGPLTKAVVIAALPVVALLLIWGPVMALSYARFGNSGNYAISEMPSRSPWSMFLEMTAEPNFIFPVWTVVAIGLVLLPRLIGSGRSLSQAAETRIAFDFYFVIVTLGPFLVAFVLFLFASQERYSSRYFVYATPPLAILLALAIDDLWRGARSVLPQLSAITGIVVCIVAALAIVMPLGMKAATYIKEDYRGIADATLIAATFCMKQMENPLSISI